VAVDPEQANGVLFKCDRRQCLPEREYGLIAAWWRSTSPREEDLVRLCRHAEVVIIRARTAPRIAACAGSLVFTGADLTRQGSGEFYRDPAGRWRVVWAQGLRGVRPWTAVETISDSDG
jgi:competence protein ComEC